MLDTIGKLFEKLLRGGLTEVIHAAGDLSIAKSGKTFTVRRCTVNAVTEVGDWVHRAEAFSCLDELGCY